MSRCECAAEILNRPRSGITSFPSRPCLGLEEQRAELADELARTRIRTVQCLDPPQSLENRLGLVHASTVAPSRSRRGHGFEPGQ